jgi:hypothetical protein
MNDKVKNNNIFDAITNGTNTVFDYLQKYDVKDKVKHIFMQYVYQNDKKPVVSEPLFFIRLKFAKFGLLTETGLVQFSRIQRLYHILLRFVNRCKTRRCKIYDVDEDLCLVPFDTLDPRKIIRIKQQGCIYRFNIHDLVNIITTSLTNQYFMIPDPRAPKNPYTNVEFERHHIINIFVRIWELKIKMRPLLYYYFQSNFHIEKFKNRNRLMLCDMSIDSGLTLETIITQDIATDLLNLIQTYSNPFLQIHLHPLFPLKLLYRIFRPYLKLYYKTKLHNCPVLEERLRHGLCCFALFNPQFGRKYVRNDETVAYDDRHLEYGDFTEGAFYELRKMSVFEIIKKYRKNRNNMFCISIEPYKNVKYVYGESIIQYPVLQAAEAEEEEEIAVVEDDEEDW